MSYLVELAELISGGARGGGIQKCAFDMVEQIVTNKECFRLSTPLRKGEGG
jgi:hypothetical protein